MNDQGKHGVAASWPDREQPIHKLQYDGTIGALYWIFVKNLLLGIITLTFYRFWGKTNLRRYAWSHTSLQGERFEYTGRGSELFIGFLIVAAIYAVGAIGLSVLSLAYGEIVMLIGQFGLLFLILYLIFVAQYAAQNYRLTRTLWCGIRGGMTGNAWRYGFKGFLFTVLNLLTLNLAVPWTSLRLAEDRFNNSYFGNAKASLQASATALYGSFLLGIIGAIVGAIVWIMILTALSYPLIAAFDLQPILDEIMRAAETGAEPQLSEEQSQTFTIALICFVIAVYLGAVLISIIAFAPYVAVTFRTIANNLRIAELRFSSGVSAWDYIKLWFGNFLLIVPTVGLGFPVAVHRTIRFFANRIAIVGALDVERLQQGALDRPKLGEGLLEAFDPGIF